MEGRERDCEKLRQRETIRETKQGLWWQQRQNHGDPQRREGGRDSCHQHGSGSLELGVWPASHHLLTSKTPLRDQEHGGKLIFGVHPLPLDVQGPGQALGMPRAPEEPPAQPLHPSPGPFSKQTPWKMGQMRGS